MCQDDQDQFIDKMAKTSLPFRPPPETRTVSNLTEQSLRIDAARERYISDQVVRFDIPTTGLLEPQSVRLSFTVSFEVSNTVDQSAICLPFDARTVFTRARLLLGRTCILQDISEYGMLCKLTTLLNSNFSDFVSSDSMLRGTHVETAITGVVPGNRARRNYHNLNGNTVTNNIGSNPRRYTVELNLGLFNQHNYIPLHLLGQPLHIELTVAKLREAAYLFNSAGTASQLAVTGRIVITNPEINLTIQNPTLVENQSLLSLMQSRKLHYQYTAFDHTRLRLDVTNARHRLVIPTFRKRIMYALAVLRSESDIENILSDPTNTYLSLDPRTGNTGLAAQVYYANDNPRTTALKYYQWSLGNQYTSPDNPVRVVDIPSLPYDATTLPDVGYTGQSAESYYHLQRVIGSKKINGGWNLEYPWGYIESGAAVTPTNTTPLFTNKLNVTTTYAAANAETNDVRSYTAFFVMAGKFYNERPDGSLEFLDGAGNNDRLVLNLEFNSGFTTNGTIFGQSKMHCEVYVAYDARLEINGDSDVNLDA